MEQQVLLADRVRLSVQAAARENARLLSKALADYQISPSQAEVISLLASKGPLSIKRIGELMIAEQTSPSRLIKRMETEKLVKVSCSKTDRRVSLVKLTRRGKRAAEVIVDINIKIDIATAKHLSTSEQLQLEILLSKLAKKPFGSLVSR